MAALLQGLSDADDASVAEHAEHVVHKPALDAVQLHILRVEEADERLRHGQTNGFHINTLLDVRLARRGVLISGLPSTRSPAS